MGHMVPPTAFMFMSYLLSLQVKSYWSLNKAWIILQNIIKQTVLFSPADQIIFSIQDNIFNLQLSISAAVFRRGGSHDVPGQKQAGQEACQRYSECGSPSSVGFILLH